MKNGIDAKAKCVYFKQKQYKLYLAPSLISPSPTSQKLNKPPYLKQTLEVSLEFQST